MDKRTLVTVSIILTVFLMVGQGITYWANPNSFGSEMQRIGDDIEYELSSSAAVEYSVTIFENGTDFDGIYIYYDEGFTSYQSHSQQRAFINQLMLEFDKRNTERPTIVDADKIADLMESGAAVGIIVVSGILPPTVFSDVNSTAVDWVNGGGVLYWAGGILDSCYIGEGGQIIKLSDPGTRFFGIRSVNTENGKGSVPSENRDIGRMLSMNAGNLRGGLMLGLPDTLYLGFQNDDFSSISVASVGSGMVAVLGGGLDGEVRVSLAQMVCSGITPDSFGSIEYKTGSFQDSYAGSATVSGSATAYVYYGGDHIVYGKRFFL
ncbi:MAG: hypothetical protein GX137_03895 [Thermoplasmatales archaeon]|nr:hypothetical protein [Thermoplasmatales archaeon]